MNDNKLLIAVSVPVVAVLALAGVILYQGRPDVNVNVAGDEPTSGSPITLTVEGKPVTLNVDGQPVVVSGDATSGENVLGAVDGEITYWISGDFSDDLNVQGDLTVGGTTTFSGAVSGVPRVNQITMGSTTGTCAVRNTSGADRVLLDIGAKFDATTAGNAGTFNFVVGTSTNAYTTSSLPFFNASITTLSGSSVITPTSTLRGYSQLGVATSTSAAVSALWRNGEWLTWKSGTTTQSGTCYAVSTF